MTWAELYLKWADIFIRFLEAIFSWPVAFTVITLFILSKYKQSIKELLSRLSEGEFAGSRWHFVARPQEIEEKQEELKETQIQEEQKKTEQDDLIEELIRKAELKGGEAETYRKQYEQTQMALTQLHKKQKDLENQLDEASMYKEFAEFSNEQKNILRILSSPIGKNATIEDDLKKIQAIIDKMIINPKYLALISSMNLVNGDNQLTPRGMKILLIYLRTSKP